MGESIEPGAGKYEDPLTDDHLRAIGRIIVRWSMTERVVMDSLWEVATGHSFGPTYGPEAGISLALVTGMSTRVAMGILRAVFRARHPPEGDELDRIADKLDKLGKVRDVVAHGRWTAGKRPGSIEAATFVSSRKLGVRLHGFTAKELDATADRIKDETWDLVDFLQKHGYWKPTKPPEPSPPPTP